MFRNKKSCRKDTGFMLSPAWDIDKTHVASLENI